jgi:predicted NodU family carbamoyl transferase
MVNVVRGSMEYGPRALCHTSTLAYPDKRLAKQINQMNNRVNEMPFGLVVTKEQAEELFWGTEKVHKSLEYMIITRQFKRGMTEFMEGGAHYYPVTGTYTCRPQVTKDPMMVEILNATGPLINTSWNYHGTPIVRSTDEILYTHAHERHLASDFVITLIEEELTR